VLVGVVAGRRSIGALASHDRNALRDAHHWSRAARTQGRVPGSNMAGRVEAVGRK